MPSDGKEYVSQFPNANQEKYSDMREAVKGANVLYVTRVQKERFEDLNEYEKVKWAYVVDAALSVMPHQILLLCILYHECMR